MRTIGFPLAMLGLAIGIGCTDRGTTAAQAQSKPAACRAIDGDTLDCEGERIRLNGVDAPEMPGHCRRGRQCVPGDPIASRDHLQRAVDRGNIEITRLKTDRYGRTVAQVTADGYDLSCIQIGDGNGVYVERWDEGGRTNAACE